MTAVDALIALSRRSDPITVEVGTDLAGLQLAAARERFAEMRQRVRILDQRATDTGVESIERLDDLVPVLFAHTAYKSYPASFADKGQWDRLTTWFETVSSTSMSDVDVTGVTDVDGWIERLEAAGHFVISSSGTSGKASFIDQTRGDVDRIADLLTLVWGWPAQPPRDNSRPVFSLTPSSGPSRVVYAFQAQRKYNGRPDAIYTLTDEPIRMAELNRIMLLQQAMASGQATPSEVAQFEAGISGRARSARQPCAHRPCAGRPPQRADRVSRQLAAGVGAARGMPRARPAGGRVPSGLDLPGQRRDQEPRAARRLPGTGRAVLRRGAALPRLRDERDVDAQPGLR
jgi:hypothetical protein